MYAEINKGMYGIKQSAIISYLQLVNQMDGHRYYTIPCTIGLCAYWNLSTKFCLCLDNLGIKYFSKYKVDNIINGIKKNYAVSTDWGGNKIAA